MRTAATLALALFAAVAAAAGSWCLGMEGLGPIRAGMPLEEVLRRADFSGMERKRSAEQCWYLRHGEDFELMIIGGVARIEINGTSKLRPSPAQVSVAVKTSCARYMGRVSTCSRTSMTRKVIPSIPFH